MSLDKYGFLVPFGDTMDISVFPNQIGNDHQPFFLAGFSDQRLLINNTKYPVNLKIGVIFYAFDKVAVTAFIISKGPAAV